MDAVIAVASTNQSGAPRRSAGERCEVSPVPHSCYRQSGLASVVRECSASSRCRVRTFGRASLELPRELIAIDARLAPNKVLYNLLLYYGNK